MRSFLCIEIKKPEILTKVLQFQDELKFANARIKFVEAENLHLTLKFLGDIEPTLIDNIYSVMKKIPFSTFTINLETVGYFPTSRPRVIWIGILEGQDELSSIITYLNNKLRNLGFKPEKRKPSVHLTIGRIKSVKDRNSLLDILQKWKNNSFGKMQVTSIQLKKSVLTPKGPIYTILKQIPN